MVPCHLYSMLVFDTADENVDILYRLFCKRENAIGDYLGQLTEKDFFSVVVDCTVKRIFGEQDWLDLYENEGDYFSDRQPDPLHQKQAFQQLFGHHAMLNPPHGEPLEKIIQHILYHPDNDLRQKVLARETNMSTSYFSMLFTAQTGLHYVDYISCVKLMRSAWLLKNTGMKVSEIAARMYYKDTTYFSRQFKKIFHLTPSEYRIPDAYKFEI